MCCQWSGFPFKIIIYDALELAGVQEVDPGRLQVDHLQADGWVGSPVSPLKAMRVFLIYIPHRPSVSTSIRFSPFRKIDLLSKGLMSLGIRPRQNVVILAETRQVLRQKHTRWHSVNRKLHIDFECLWLRSVFPFLGVDAHCAGVSPYKRPCGHLVRYAGRRRHPPWFV